MRTLIIINGYYPYNRGEDYLSNELKYVNGFDKVVTFPMFVYGNKDPLNIYDYPVDGNVLYTNSLKGYKSRLIYCIYFMFCHNFFYEELWSIIRNKKLYFSCLMTFLRTSFKSVNAYCDLKKIIKKESNNGDVTLYSYWMADTAVTVSLLKRYSSFPINYSFTRAHRFDVYEYANLRNYLPYRKFIFSMLDKIYVISNDAKEYLEKMYLDYVKGKIEVHRLGTEDYGHSEVCKSRILRIVSCSWLRPVKRVSLILDALDLLQIPIEWTHYGDGEEMELLRDKLIRLKNKNLKVALAGQISNKQILNIYQNNPYDVFINVSENEGVPVSIMEAMSFGMLIIATNVGGTGEIVRDGENGYLLNKECSSQDIASKINNVYNLSNARYTDMRHLSRMLWLEFSSSKVNYERFYNELKSKKS